MPEQTVVAYPTSQDCSECGGTVIAPLSHDGHLSYKGDFVAGQCASCHEPVGLPRVKVDTNSPIYGSSD